MNKVLKGVLVVLAVVSCSGEALSKEWHKIVPLISTRADVERLLGKPGKLNRYQFDDERASILYSSGPCSGSDLGLRTNCKCLVPKDTVLAIYVEPETTLKFRSLNLDRRNFTRTPSIVDPMRVSYSNETEGVDYTVDETNDEIMMVEYVPSARDCRKIVERNSRKKRNRTKHTKPKLSAPYER